MNPIVKTVSAEKGHRLYLEFTNGERREFDVTPYLDKGIFKELENDAYFEQPRASMGTVEWPNGQDFRPDTLYELAKVIA